MFVARRSRGEPSNPTPFFCGSDASLVFYFERVRRMRVYL